MYTTTRQCVAYEGNAHVEKERNTKADLRSMQHICTYSNTAANCMRFEVQWCTSVIVRLQDSSIIFFIFSSLLLLDDQKKQQTRVQR